MGALTLLTDVRTTRAGPPARGVPGAHNVAHVGLTVPDLNQAVKFFVDVLGDLVQPSPLRQGMMDTGPDHEDPGIEPMSLFDAVEFTSSFLGYPEQEPAARGLQIAFEC